MSVQATEDDEPARFTVDANGRITAWDAGAEGLFGWPEAEILGRDFRTLVPTTRTSEASARFDALRRFEPGAGLPVIARRKDGTQIEVVSHVWPSRGADGAFLDVRVETRLAAPRSALLCVACRHVFHATGAAALTCPSCGSRDVRRQATALSASDLSARADSAGLG